METAPARETALADWTASPGGSRTNKRSSSRQSLLFEFYRHPAPHPFSSPSRGFSGWVGALLASALTINLYS